MIKRLSVIVCAVLLMAGCKDKDNFVINGKFTNSSQGSKVYLDMLTASELVAVDSTVLSDAGEFKFKKPDPESNLYRLRIEGRTYMIVAKNGEEIEFTADLSDTKMNYKLEGSGDAEDLSALNELVNKYNNRLDKVMEDFEKQVEAAPEQREALTRKMQPFYLAQRAEMGNEILKFAEGHTSSLVSFYAVSFVDPKGNDAGLIAYADKIKGKFGNVAAVKAFVDQMEQMKKLTIGQIAPDFTLTGMNGRETSLSSMRGKYVLVDFWASWCQPCRLENPNIVAAWSKFKDKNFTVLGTSIDTDIAAWKDAVKADNLTWTQVSDPEGNVARMYQVVGIPSSFLLDPSGKIIAKDLRGDALDTFLAANLK